MKSILRRPHPSHPRLRSLLSSAMAARSILSAARQPMPRRAAVAMITRGGEPSRPYRQVSTCRCSSHKQLQREAELLAVFLVDGDGQGRILGMALAADLFERLDAELGPVGLGRAEQPLSLRGCATRRGPASRPGPRSARASSPSPPPSTSRTGGPPPPPSSRAGARGSGVTCSRSPCRWPGGSSRPRTC